MSSSFSRCHLIGSILDCFDDIHIPGASAKVTGDRVANFLFGWVWISFEERGRGHHHARCAKAALQTMVFMESLLNGMQLPVRCKTLHGLDFHSIGLNGKDRTRLDRFAIQLHGAGPA
jgi:hypothetical protein